MFWGLKRRLPLITAAITQFADKYGFVGAANRLRKVLVSALTEAYTISNNQTPDLGQLSVLFRNVVVQHQKAIQQLLNAFVTFLRETQITLPGIKETTLPEICQQIKNSIVVVFEQVISAITGNLKAHVLPTVKTIKIVLPNGAILTGDEILSYIESALTDSVNSVKELKSFDVILEDLGHVFQEVVDQTQEFIEMIQSDFPDNLAAEINTLYTYYIRLVNSLIDSVNSFLNSGFLYVYVDSGVDLIIFVLDGFKYIVYTVFPTSPADLVNVQDGRLKMDISFPFYQ